jgi:hypothetical protein
MYQIHLNARHPEIVKAFIEALKEELKDNGDMQSNLNNGFGDITLGEFTCAYTDAYNGTPGTNVLDFWFGRFGDRNRQKGQLQVITDIESGRLGDYSPRELALHCIKRLRDLASVG